MNLVLIFLIRYSKASSLNNCCSHQKFI